MRKNIYHIERGLSLSLIVTHHKNISLHRSKNISQTGSTRWTGESLSSLCVFVKLLLGWQARCILSTLVYTQTAAVSTTWPTPQALHILIICQCFTEGTDTVNNKVLMGTNFDKLLTLS